MAEGLGIRLSDTALIENSQGLVSISNKKKSTIRIWCQKVTRKKKPQRRILTSDSRRLFQNITINQATYAKIETKKSPTSLAGFLQAYTRRTKPAALLKSPEAEEN